MRPAYRLTRPSNPWYIYLVSPLPMEETSLMEDQMNSTATPAAPSKTKRQRSPAYPAVNLAEALQRAEVLRKEAGKNQIHVDGILDVWRFKPKSGGGMAILSALLKFNLLEDEGTGDTRRARLTPFALDILLDDRPDSPAKTTKLKEAALAPAIHREMWDKYQGAIPGDVTLRVYLRRDRGFGDTAADDLVNEFRETIAYAKLSSTDSISPTVEDKTKPDGEGDMAQPLTIDPTPETAAEAEKLKDVTKARVNRTVQIPLTGAPWVLLQVPYPMTDANWDQMQEQLDLLKKPLTTPPDES